jgi:osmotically-inducible protein OsmY
MDSSTVAIGLAAQALRQNSNPTLRRISVEETAEVVVLTGRVTSYYGKQLAQEAVLPHLGGRELINRIVVIPIPKK